MAHDDKKWYRPIGIRHGSDYLDWWSELFYLKDGRSRMGPDFIGYLVCTTTDGYKPTAYGENIVTKEFVFFN